MGTTLALATGGMLDGHEGWLEFLDAATGSWSSTWGHEALGAEGHDPVAVRAACECGWRGVGLPWTARAGHPNDSQEDALMAVWYHEHANPLRAIAEKESS